ncbi:hypothetical protein [Gracilibacillus kekensis]|uniref:Uncharacterized protein n=1 Tax=Gracilibacillus kekensis TaxID=1027249 RepID=A0A1M7Q8X2_9BACI|nr:hypothetical protein [Gracilibacillus kekensis]SHN27113.1 hypothetical protein SAMN05216179_2931 [Gracilibacillus kekensis]
MKKWVKIIGILIFLIAVAIFCLQLGSFIAQPLYQAEYIDNRLFYLFNIIIVLSLGISMLLLLSLNKRRITIIVTIGIIMTAINVYLMYESNQGIKNITSVSPSGEEVFAIKSNTYTGEATYYRSYFRILGRPHKELSQVIEKGGPINWLTDDIAVFTYLDKNQHIQQFVGTYGDRQDGRSYYYVGSQIRGNWQGENTRVIANSDGITIMQQGNDHFFDWDHVQQYGTLAIVLSENDQAKWTIALGADFSFDDHTPEPPTGEIILYKAKLKNTEAIALEYIGEAQSMQ